MIKIKACAKLNLALDIANARADGYHDMRMIMQSVDLCDIITADFERGAPISVTCDMPIDGENLAEKAIIAYSRAAGYPIGGTVHIEKHIPLCGGLGGGSADAAAVLWALHRQFCAVDADSLPDIALSLGADVPFALYGGTAYAAGVGERLVALPAVSKDYILLARAGNKDSTGRMFARFDAAADKIHPDVDAAVSALRTDGIRSASRFFANSFSPLWKGEVSDKIHNVMRSHGAYCTSLSGAGPTVFGLFESGDRARVCADEISKFTWCALCRPADRSIFFE
jgi:4-diphosphocytidyl-2-C-methyl-D-erythritol kinase